MMLPQALDIAAAVLRTRCRHLMSRTELDLRDNIARLREAAVLVQAHADSLKADDDREDV